MAKATRRGRGRPTLLTAELADRITSQVRVGMPIELAAEACGISRQTVLEWVRRGEGREDDDRPADAKDGLYEDFANRYRQARAEFAQQLLIPCLEAIRGTRASKKKKGPDGKPVLVKALGAPTRAAEAHWHLARRFPEFWGSGRETPAFIEAAQAATVADERPPAINIILAPEPDEERQPEATLPEGGAETADGEQDDGEELEGAP